MSALSFSGVTKRYGDTPVLDDVDLKVPAGRRTVIVGPSGSGKTTLLRLAAGFDFPDAGRIELGETLLVGGSAAVPAHRRDIGYVTQEGALFPHLSVGANIGFGMPRQLENREQRITELLERVGLSSTMCDRRPHQLSGGQQQRVALARALARQPRLMLLDEPFSALDTDLRDTMRDMVGEVLGAAGITTVLVTHDRSEALSFADHVAVMRSGRLVQAGAPQEIYLHPADPQTARFLGDALVLDATIENGTAATELGPIPAASAPGSRMIMIRPEQIRIGAPGDSADRPQGLIVGRTYLGAAWRIDVTVPHPASAISFSCSIPGPTAPVLGSAVGIWIEGEAHVFPS